MINLTKLIIQLLL